MRHAYQILLFDLLLPFAPLRGHDVLHDLVCDHVLDLAHDGRADVLGTAEAQFFAQGVIVGDEREAAAEEVLILGEGKLVDELAWKGYEVEAKTLEENMLTWVRRVWAKELGSLVERTEAQDEDWLKVHINI